MAWREKSGLGQPSSVGARPTPHAGPMASELYDPRLDECDDFDAEGEAALVELEHDGGGQSRDGGKRTGGHFTVPQAKACKISTPRTSYPSLSSSSVSRTAPPPSYISRTEADLDMSEEAELWRLEQGLPPPPPPMVDLTRPDDADVFGAAAAREAHASSAAAEPPPRGCSRCSAGQMDIKESRTEKNPGRKYYKCSSCSKFEWCDEVVAAGGGGAGNDTFGSGGYGGGGFGGCGGYGDGYGRGSAPTVDLTMDGGPNKCYKCQGTGHWARDCPNPQAGATTAAGCGGGGRFAGGDGHGGGYASARGGGGGNNSSSTSTCYKCQGTGHWARDCPNAPGGGGGTGGYGNSRGGSAGSGGGKGECFKCGQPGHWASQCPGGGSSARGGDGGSRRY